jgi:hypothetical protein
MGLLNPLFTKNFRTAAAIAPYRIVRQVTTDDQVQQTSAVGDFAIGVSTSIASPINDRCDVIMAGIAEVEYGGTVTRGALLTTDASGRAVVAAPAAGVNNRIIGFALESGVVGDIGSVFLSPGSVQG